MSGGTAVPPVKLRPLEREDLAFVHQMDNNASIMRYWFEEPYEAFIELSDLYDKHIHDQSTGNTALPSVCVFFSRNIWS